MILFAFTFLFNSPITVYKNFSNTKEIFAAQTTLKVVKFNSKLKRNSNAVIEVSGKANTKYSITVYYSSSASTAEGLQDKTSDSNGKVSWTWKVGGKTKLGSYKLYISGGNEKIEVPFSVID